MKLTEAAALVFFSSLFFFISFFSEMLLFLRNLFRTGCRASSSSSSYRVSPLSSIPQYPSNCRFINVSSLTSSSSHATSLMACPFVWFTGFLCIFRFPFVTKSQPSSFPESLNTDSLSRIVQHDYWDDPRIVNLFDSALAPIWVSRFLVELKGDPKLALKLFKCAKTRIGFRHTTESYCILVHILFFAKMYFDAHQVLRELVLLSRALPGCDVFDVLWLTRNVCRLGFGVFDALFGVLVEVGMLEEASECFLMMKKFRVLPKVRSCNALLRRLSKPGNGNLSRKFFKDMLGAGINPSVFTYNIMIGYMCKEGDLDTASSLFAQMKRMGLTPDVVTYNSLIDGYGKVGLLDDSVRIFEEMKDADCEPDTITFNSLINCCCKFDRMPQALNFLREMNNNGLKPNVITYSTLIDAFCKEGMMQEAVKIFMDMKRVGLLPNEFTYTSLIDANCKAGNLSEALKLKSEMLQAGISWNIVTHTALLDGLCEDGRMDEAEEVFREVQKSGIIPNQQICTALLHGYIKAKRIENAMEIWNEIKGKGFKPDLLLYGTIIWGLCSQNKLEESELVLKEMKGYGLTANHFIYTTLMDAYYKAGKTEAALNLIQEMRDNGIELTVVTYCALIDGLCKKGLFQEATSHFRTMPDLGLQPNVAVFTALIDGLCKNNCIEAAKELFNEMVDKGLIPDKAAYTTLMDGNLKHGNLEEALSIQRRMREIGMELDLYAYTSLIWGLSEFGQVKQAKMFLDEMIGKGILPDEILCISLLRKYYKLGNLDEAIELQIEMVNRGLISGTRDHVIPNLRLKMAGREAAAAATTMAVVMGANIPAESAITMWGNVVGCGDCHGEVRQIPDDQTELSMWLRAVNPGTMSNYQARSDSPPKSVLHTTIRTEDGFLELAHPSGIVTLCPAQCLPPPPLSALQFAIRYLLSRIDGDDEFGRLSSALVVELKFEEMGSRIQQHYAMRSPPANSYIGNALHDLNTADAARPAAEIDSIDGDSVAEDTHLREDDGSGAVVDGCMHEAYTNSLPLHSVRLGVEDDRSASSGGCSSTSRAPYCLLSLQDVSPIESARARFLQLIVDHFISEHVVEVPNSEAASSAEYNGALSHSGQEKLNKRKPGEVRYEGDPRLALPLMYVANMYQTLVNDANIRLSSLSGFREKTIGVALEASGGLYRCLAKKFPKKGSRTFRRRELATSVETRTRFPELVIQEEKRVRFVVVNGLDIVEKPTRMPTDDAEWFKRLTGRDEVAVYARDFKFYSPRHKYRRVASNSSPNSIASLPTFPGTDNSSMLAAAQGFRSASEPQNQQTTPSCKHHMQPLSHQPQFQPVHQTHHQSINQSPHAVHYSQNHQCGATSHLPEIAHAHHSPTMSQHMVCLQPLTGGHVGGRLHVLPSSPAKFCDECGAPYLRETSKFCSECGVKRLGV
ncbi:putative pentatricopeptide repeat-containing protein At2g02150 [Pyrus communis]|uniref:putative pentatricopeptide repeat-containing protein At2g02150 n=1 Tax=Pyrus communis TaxID=23211 RepID=UPI0035C1F5B2